MSSGNVVNKYADNPYFDGVISPITTQGEITLNCRADKAELQQRRANMQGSKKNTSYPEGSNLENQHILPHELCFGWTNKQGRNAIPGHPNHVGFTTLNGVNWGAYSTNEELTGRLRLLGIVKTPFFFDDVNQLQHGFTVIAAGTGTTHHTGEEDIYPGDVLQWDVVARPSVPGGYMPGGAFGDNGPGSRQTNPRVGTSRTRIRFRINPSHFNDMRPSINAMLGSIRKTQAQGGVSNVPFENLFERSRGGASGNFNRPTPANEHAMALSATMVVTATSAIQLLVDRGLLQYAAGPGNPSDELSLTDRIGVFETTDAKRQLFYDMVDNWFMGFAANASTSRPYNEQFRAKHRNAFDAISGRLVRHRTTESRYAQVRYNLANMQELGWARAYHSVSRRRFGLAISFAKKGQGVDVMVSHHRNA